MRYGTGLIFFILMALAPGWGAVSEAQTAKDYFDEGNDLSRAGRYREAVEAYRRSLETAPGAAVVYYNMGLALMALEQYPGAVAALEKVVEMEPYNLDAHLTLGNIFNRMERWEDAIAHLNLVVHLRAGDPEAHGNLGWAYYNFRKGPRFKFLVIINLSKAAELFEQRGNPRAAAATRKTLEQALAEFELEEKN